MKTTLVLMVTAFMVAGLQAAEAPKDETRPFTLTTKLGETYRNCRIVKATPEALTVVHDGGVAKIHFESLGDEWKQKFGYDPAKAREFASAEEKRLKEDAAKREALNKKREETEEDMLAELAAKEKRRLMAEAKLVKEEADAAKAANTPPQPLAPLPGDAVPKPTTQVSQPVMQTEVVVPTMAPITDVFTPTRIRSQTYILQDGSYFGGYSPYGYYQPIYSYPGTGYPMHGHGHHGYSYPVPHCPPSSPILRPGVSGTISTGGVRIHINR